MADLASSVSAARNLRRLLEDLQHAAEVLEAAASIETEGEIRQQKLDVITGQLDGAHASLTTAQTQAAETVDRANQTAADLVRQATDAAETLRAQTEASLTDEFAALTAQRDAVRQDVAQAAAALASLQADRQDAERALAMAQDQLEAARKARRELAATLQGP